MGMLIEVNTVSDRDERMDERNFLYHIIICILYQEETNCKVYKETIAAGNGGLIERGNKPVNIGMPSI